MKTTLVLCLAASLLTACHSQPTEQPESAPAAPEAATPPAAPAAPVAPSAAAPATDTAQARKWLIASIEENFSNEDQEHRNMDPKDPSSIYTPQYLEYKLDAIQLEYTEEENPVEKFEKKWAGRYNTKLVGSGTFLLVQGQDNGEIKVSRCTFKERTQDNGLLFTVSTKDPMYNTKETGDIKVIHTPQGYKIDDVREY